MLPLQLLMTCGTRHWLPVETHNQPLLPQHNPHFPSSLMLNPRCCKLLLTFMNENASVGQGQHWKTFWIQSWERKLVHLPTTIQVVISTSSMKWNECQTQMMTNQTIWMVKAVQTRVVKWSRLSPHDRAWTCVPNLRDYAYNTWALLTWMPVEATQGQRTKNQHTCELWEERDGVGLGSFKRKPKESSNGEPPGAGLHSIYTTIHEGCTRLSIGLCTVHDIIVELGARLYDIKGGSVRSTRHRSRLL